MSSSFSLPEGAPLTPTGVDAEGLESFNSPSEWPPYAEAGWYDCESTHSDLIAEADTEFDAYRNDARFEQELEKDYEPFEEVFPDPDPQDEFPESGPGSPEFITEPLSDPSGSGFQMEVDEKFDSVEQVFPDPNWRSRLVKNKHDEAYQVLGNVVRTLQYAPHWHNAFAYNCFSEAVFTTKRIGAIPAGTKIADEHEAQIAAALLDDGLRVGSTVVHEAIRAVSAANQIHPVRDYLNGLAHDGIDRVAHWLYHYCGADSSSYTAEVGTRWLISAVARIFEPGCKVDSCLIFEGPQGAGKSTVIKILGGEWYNDGLTDIGTKDAVIKLRGKWIVEIPELSALDRRESSEIKAFMSTAVDRYRPPYARSAIDSPRHFVFAGTVNHDVYLRDETGQRRFWPVETGIIDLGGLFRDRDQLWAEAVALYRAGSPWHLDTPELVAQAKVRQASKLDLDVWQERIENYCAGLENVSVSEILSSCIGKPLSYQNQQDKNRAARCLQIMGWQKFRASTEAGARPWRYKPPAGEPALQPESKPERPTAHPEGCSCGLCCW